MDEYGGSVGGGGRYDEMIGKFTGQATPAVGFSIGFERIITILRDHMEGDMKIDENNTAFLIDKKVPSEKKMEVLRQAAQLRAQGTTVIVQPMRKNMKQQINMLEAQGYTKFEKIYKD